VLNTAVVPFHEPFFVLFVGRYENASGSKTFNAFDSRSRNNVAMFCEEKRRRLRKVSGGEHRSMSIHSIVVLAFNRPDLCLIFLERINMHHPVEDHWMECSSRRIACFLRRNGSAQTKLRVRLQHLFPASCGWRAEIHVLVPLRHAQRYPFIQLIFR